MKRVRVLAQGLVQGVFFRAALRDGASRRGVTGWVRNTADGAVEAELQGSPEDVAAMVEFCRRGPGRAVVESLDVQDVQTVDGETCFQVRS